MPTLRRRDFVASLGLGAGAYLLDPMCRRLVAEARGDAATPRRLVLFGFGCGMPTTLYEHDTQGAAEAAFGPALPLRKMFQPLEQYKSDLLVLERFFVPPSIIGDGLHGAGESTFSQRARGAGPTFDRYLAAALGAKDAFSSVNLSYAWSPHDVGYENRSLDATGGHYVPETNPARALDSFFGAGAATPTSGTTPAAADPRKRLAKQKSVLDAARADIVRVQARLAGAERAKLDQYLASLRELETRLDTLAAAAAAPPARGCARPGWALTLPKYPTGNIVYPDVVDAFVDLVFNALACGRTHVATYWMQMGAGGGAYKFLGDPEASHQDHHAGRTAILEAIMAYHVSTVAALWAKLKAVPEGNGTMADNTLVLLMNDAGGQHHNGSGSHAVIALGRLGGTLRTGRYVKYPKGRYTLGDVYIALANALGVPTTSFGVQSTGDLPGLS